MSRHALPWAPAEQAHGAGNPAQAAQAQPLNPNRGWLHLSKRLFSYLLLTLLVREACPLVPLLQGRANLTLHRWRDTVYYSHILTALEVATVYAPRGSQGLHAGTERITKGWRQGGVGVMPGSTGARTALSHSPNWQGTESPLLRGDRSCAGPSPLPL